MELWNFGVGEMGKGGINMRGRGRWMFWGGFYFDIVSMKNGSGGDLWVGTMRSIRIYRLSSFEAGRDVRL